jgi:hypothetical protein
MADIKSLVACLENRCLIGIGAKPDRIPSGTVLSGDQRVKAKYVNIKVSLKQNRFSCQEAASDGDCDGYYIFFEEGWATVGGNLTCKDEMIVASGSFSGCAYKIYHVGGDAYKCVHIARPAGGDPDVYVKRMAGYANANKWKEVLAVPTAGLIVGRCSEVFVVSQYYHNMSIETVRLQIDNQGLIVAHDVYSVQIP